MSETGIRRQTISGPSAWVRRDLSEDDWRVPLSAECIDEIRCVADEIGRLPLPVVVLRPEDFAMPACRERMVQVRRVLDRGVGFALVDRLPVEEIGESAGTAVYWLLSSMVARPVAQKLDGTLVYDVRDTGQQALPGSGVRPDKTNIELKFHNDNAYNRTPPEYVGLLCQHPAPSGGRSRVISFHSVYNRLLAECPQSLRRLYRPFWFDRQREFFDGENATFAAPVFEAKGELRTRFSVHQINSGYAVRGEALDPEGQEAIAAMDALFQEDALSFDFALAAGQIEFVHNRALGHARTAFVDDPAPAMRRHLVRLWLRDSGHRAYPG
jgi:alpha-ketoglutarate-dependent taurine dioxygenase